MSKKKLLSEAQVKRFMGLAGLNPLNEMNSYNEEQEEAEMPPMADEEPAEKPEMGPAEEPEMDMDGEAADVEMDEQDLADVAGALSVLQDKLAPLLDQAEEAEEMPEEERNTM